MLTYVTVLTKSNLKKETKPFVGHHENSTVLCGAPLKNPQLHSHHEKPIDTHKWRDPLQTTATPGSLPRKSHGQRSLAGYSLQGRKESGMTEVT